MSAAIATAVGDLLGSKGTPVLAALVSNAGKLRQGLSWRAIECRSAQREF